MQRLNLATLRHLQRGREGGARVRQEGGSGSGRAGGGGSGTGCAVRLAVALSCPSYPTRQQCTIAIPRIQSCARSMHESILYIHDLAMHNFMLCMHFLAMHKFMLCMHFLAMHKFMLYIHDLAMHKFKFPSQPPTLILTVLLTLSRAFPPMACTSPKHPPPQVRHAQSVNATRTHSQ